MYVEANAYGKFVVGSKSGGIPDAIQNGITGFLSEENDISSLTKCIDDFFSPQFTYSPQECVDWAKRHSEEIVGEKYEAEILKIIENE